MTIAKGIGVGALGAGGLELLIAIIQNKVPSLPTWAGPTAQAVLGTVGVFMLRKKPVLAIGVGAATLVLPLVKGLHYLANLVSPGIAAIHAIHALPPRISPMQRAALSAVHGGGIGAVLAAIHGATDDGAANAMADQSYVTPPAQASVRGQGFGGDDDDTDDDDDDYSRARDELFSACN
ncbi:MAG: hypothetical protein ACHQQR_00765 [Gemmatimonadales bacterium]